jgi:hypothetical protein
LDLTFLQMTRRHAGRNVKSATLAAKSAQISPIPSSRKIG